MLIPSFLLALSLSAPAQQGSVDLAAPIVVELDARGRRYQAGELLIGLEGPFERTGVLEEVTRRGGVLTGEIPQLRLLKVALPPGLGEELEVQRYAQLPGVKFAELNYIGEGAVDVPTDEDFIVQWHHRNTGQSGGTPGVDLESVPAWDLEQGNSAVVVAVLDTGINFDHTEFEGRLLQGFDFVNEDSDPSADHPHGTRVTGLIAASHNGENGVGMDRFCTVLPVKVLNQDNLGTTFDLIQGLAYCVQQQPDVVNMSLGKFTNSGGLGQALEAAREAGCILISAAGNGGTGDANVSWPGASPDTISIGATDHRDIRAASSGTGSRLDFVAPGVDVYTTAPVSGFVDVFTGTSAAAPIASGIVSQLKSRYPVIGQLCAYELLRQGAEDEVGPSHLDAPGKDDYYGHGRLNALRSFEATPPCATGSKLTASPDRIPIDTGGSQAFELSSDKDHAGLFYLLLGSGATQPGFTADGVQIPLALDTFLVFSAGAAGSSLYPNSAGFLDAKSSATAALTLPPGSSPALLGLELFHAFIVVDLAVSGAVVAASNAVGVDFFETIVLFDEDFESGAPEWTFDNGGTGLWGFSSDGDCGISQTTMASYTLGAPVCNYSTGGLGFNSGKLVSPAVTLAGSEPFVFEFDSSMEADTFASSRVEVVDVNTGDTVVLLEDNSLDIGGLQNFVLELETAQPWTGRTVQLVFFFSSGFSPNDNAGWYVDNVRATMGTP